ncbi:MAG TPA: hypothetical protein VMX17_14610 [Candidatus Glassbacteria bacterium]|nr:hypothetical protein [Candidatus Glassbacteria bacterium]
MGQRSQIYIKMENIGKGWAKNMKLDNPKAWLDRLPEYMEAQEKYNKWKTMYGEGDTIIVAFHHQWLYGRSFPIVASMLLFAAKSFNESSHDKFFSKELWIKGESYGGGRQINLNDPNSLIEWMENYMSNLFDQELGQFARVGVERFTLLSREHKEGNNYRYDKDFTIGDNNDGVLIVDIAKVKYCFVNINSYDRGPFLMMQPVSALKYIKAYYPECFEDLDEGDTKTPEEFSDNCEINTKFAQRFNNYEVLTAQELIEMFPALTEELEKANDIKKKKKVKSK